MLSGATTLGQSGPESDGNEGVLCVTQGSSITEASPTDCFVSYLGQSLEGILSLCRDAIGIFYNWAARVGAVLSLCRNVVGIFYFTSRLGYKSTIGEEYFLVASDIL